MGTDFLWFAVGFLLVRLIAVNVYAHTPRLTSTMLAPARSPAGIPLE
jgi:hypothetical protein